MGVNKCRPEIFNAQFTLPIKDKGGGKGKNRDPWSFSRVATQNYKGGQCLHVSVATLPTFVAYEEYLTALTARLALSLLPWAPFG